MHNVQIKLLRKTSSDRLFVKLQICARIINKITAKTNELPPMQENHVSLFFVPPGQSETNNC